MTQYLTVDVNEGIAHVQLNRPDKHNALNLDLFHELDLAIPKLSQEPGLRAVVLSGAGPSFCAGIDVQALAANPAQLKTMADMLTETDDSGANIYQRICLGWQRLPMPVIAAIDGHCYGGGMQIALGCDLRIATPQAQMSIMEIRWGLIPDMGASVTARQLLPYDVLLDLTLSGRVVDAAQAVTLGLITRVEDDAHSAALETARAIAGQSPDAVRGAKQLFLETRLAQPREALAAEARIQGSLMGRPNQMEAVMAGMAGRAAVYKD